MTCRLVSKGQCDYSCFNLGVNSCKNAGVESYSEYRQLKYSCEVTARFYEPDRILTLTTSLRWRYRSRSHCTDEAAADGKIVQVPSASERQN